MCQNEKCPVSCGQLPEVKNQKTAMTRAFWKPITGGGWIEHAECHISNGFPFILAFNVFARDRNIRHRQCKKAKFYPQGTGNPVDIGRRSKIAGNSYI